MSSLVAIRSQFFIVASALFLILPAIAADRTNVLLIVADDHAAYVTGAYGNRKVRTPNLDRLARQGMRFDRAYCNAPVCTASRQSLLTGRYPRSIGVTQLRTALPDSEKTLAEMLGESGYRTAAIGKMHFNSDRKHGFDMLIDRVDHRAYLRDNNPTPVDPQLEVLPPWRPFRAPASVWLNGSYLPYGAHDEDMAGTYFAEQAASYLQEIGDEPFFLMVSLYEPHSPFNFPIEFAKRHDPQTFDVPEVHDNDTWQIPAIFQSLTHEEKQAIIASYYTATEFMDKNVGLVLDALDAAGHRDNTLVIYLGDHGYMLGQHGRFEKHCSYEPAIRAPLLVRYPPLVDPASSSNALVQFIDVAPTILELAGIDLPSSLQGRSLVPHLDGVERSQRGYIVVEYSENEEALIRTHLWKLVYITGNRERDDGYLPSVRRKNRVMQLFDVQRDPDETTNLADDPRYRAIVGELLAKLVEHMRATSRLPDLIPDSDDPHVILAHCLQPRDVS